MREARSKNLVTYPVFACLVGLLLGGCQKYPAPAARPDVPSVGLTNPTALSAVRAWCEPPVGWRAEPLEMGTRHAHQTWVSPSGSTAYGVVAFRLPLPVGADLVIWGFLNEMRKKHNEAELLSKQEDPALPGVRFVAEGGPYRVRTNLIVRGLRGWAVYAGTRRDRPVDTTELELAERAREKTMVGYVEQAAR